MVCAAKRHHQPGHSLCRAANVLPQVHILASASCCFQSLNQSMSTTGCLQPRQGCSRPRMQVPDDNTVRPLIIQEPQLAALDQHGRCVRLHLHRHRHCVREQQGVLRQTPCCAIRAAGNKSGRCCCDTDAYSDCACIARKPAAVHSSRACDCDVSKVPGPATCAATPEPSSLQIISHREDKWDGARLFVFDFQVTRLPVACFRSASAS